MSRYLRKPIDAHALGAIQSPPVCDFCALHAPAFVYAATQTSAGQKIECWRWCACPDCAAQVESDNFVPLIMQITNMLSQKMGALIPPKVLRQAADQSLGEFRKYAIRNPPTLKEV
jgi:hypothetical protein